MSPSNQFRFDFGLFVVGTDSVCFQASPNARDVIWLCSIGGSLHKVKSIAADQVIFEDGESIKIRPFVSYKPTQGGEIYLASSGFSLAAIPNSYFVEFFHSSHPGRPIFRVEGFVEPLKGHFIDGVSQNGSSVLPGGRYALLDMFSGKKTLLVDGETGLYKEVPRDTRAWVNFNSYAHPETFRVIEHGKNWFDVELRCDKPLRTNYRQ